MKKLFIPALTGLCFLTVFAQEPPVERHSIDVEMENCIKQDSTQSMEGVGRCELAAMNAWKAEVQKNYEMLLAIFPESGQKKLTESQKRWKSYADAETLFARGAYNDKGRFPYSVVPLSRAIDIFRQRAMDLKEYYDLLNSR